MASKRNRGQQKCSYCGIQTSTATSDHVLARKLVAEQFRGNLPQVPSCQACNNEKSSVEERVSYYWMLGQTSQREVEALKKFERQHPEVRKIQETTQYIVREDQRLEMHIGDERSITLVQRWLDYLIRGLYRFHFNSVVPTTHKITFLALAEPILTFKQDHELFIENRFGSFAYRAQAIQPPDIGGIWEFDLYGLKLSDGDNRFSQSVLAILQSAESADRTETRMATK